ncbi:hypothetical protein LXL04_029235 [Taraxacum kok-saghyz]
MKPRKLCPCDRSRGRRRAEEVLHLRRVLVQIKGWAELEDEDTEFIQSSKLQMQSLIQFANATKNMPEQKDESAMRHHLESLCSNLSSHMASNAQCSNDPGGVEVLKNNAIGCRKSSYTDADIDEVREDWAYFVTIFVM